MKKLLLVPLFLSSLAAVAAPTKYTCGNVGGTEEWTIDINLKKKTASFFDNDSTATVKLKTMKLLESSPPQTLYVFEGKDKIHSGTIQISFNQTRLTASVTTDLGAKDEETLEAQNGCTAN